MISLIAQIIEEVINILIVLIVIRSILSFVPQLISSNNKLVTLLYDVTDPILKPFQRLQIGGAGMALDISPIIAYFVLRLIAWLVERLAMILTPLG